MAVNKYGLDVRYFKEKLGIIVRDCDNSSPEEMYRMLKTYAQVAEDQAEVARLKHSQNSCSNCGTTGDFCGYHQLGPQRKALCVACAESEIDVWRISLNEEKGGYYVDSKEKADNELSVLAETREEEDTYHVHPEKMSRLKFYSLFEFEGF